MSLMGIAVGLQAAPSWPIPASPSTLIRLRAKVAPRQRHYECTPFEGLAALPVASIAAEDCFLLLWIPLRSVFLVEPLM
jgi:hypothetical protein